MYIHIFWENIIKGKKARRKSFIVTTVAVAVGTENSHGAVLFSERTNDDKTMGEAEEGRMVGMGVGVGGRGEGKEEDY